MALRPPNAWRGARRGIKLLGVCAVVTALAAFGAVQGGPAAHAADTPQATAAATAPALTASATTVVVGAPVTFTYSAPSDLLSTSNWIGWYSVRPPGVQASTLWDYTQTGTQGVPPSGSSPVASGQLTFSTAGLAVGTYTVYFLYNDGYTIVGSPVTIQVTSAPVAPGTLTAAKTSPRLVTRFRSTTRCRQAT